MLLFVFSNFLYKFFELNLCHKVEFKGNAYNFITVVKTDELNAKIKCKNYQRYYSIPS